MKSRKKMVHKMDIAVCDNAPVILEDMRCKLKTCGYTEAPFLYSDMEAFFKELEDGKHFDVLFLDLNWNCEVTGLDYAKRLHKVAPYLPVIYITGYNDRFAQYILLSKTNLIGYLTKPINVELMSQYLEKVKGLGQTQKYLIFQQRGKEISLLAETISYIESNDHMATIFTDTESYVIYEKLGSLMERLPKHFVQCHKSFLVNMSCIKRLEAKKVLLQDGGQIPISKSRMIETREAFFRYIGQQL